MTDFNSLLGSKADDAKKPVPLPPGTYTVVVKDMEMVESSKKGTPGVRINYGIAKAGPDVDTKLLVDAEGKPVDLSKKSLRETFWLTEDAKYRLRDHLELLGLKINGRTFAELLPKATGLSIQAHVIQQPSDDGERVYNNISKFIKG